MGVVLVYVLRVQTAASEVTNAEESHKRSVTTVLAQIRAAG